MIGMKNALHRLLIFSCALIFVTAIAVAALFFFNFRELTALTVFPSIAILLFVFSRYLARGVLQYLAVYLIALIAALFLFELYSFVTFRGSTKAFAGSYASSYFKSNPHLGYTAYGPARYQSINYDKRTGHVVYDVVYSISELGFRETVGKQSGGSIVFLGDSFMFGEGLNDAETLPQAFSDLTARANNVLNFGFHGYGPQQGLRMLELDLFDKAIGQRPGLFVFQTAAWHADRAACIPEYTDFGPRYELGSDGKVHYKGACRSGITSYLGKLTKLSYGLREIWETVHQRPLYDADFILYTEMLKQLDAIIREKYHSRLLIAFLRFDDDQLFKASSYSNERLMDSLTRSGIAVIDVTLKPKGTFLRSYDGNDELVIKGDGHPNTVAQQRRAKLIYEWFQQYASKTD